MEKWDKKKDIGISENSDDATTHAREKMEKWCQVISKVQYVVGICSVSAIVAAIMSMPIAMVIEKYLWDIRTWQFWVLYIVLFTSNVRRFSVNYSYEEWKSERK